MNANRIRVFWNESEEYFEIDPNSLTPSPIISKTKEWWIEDQKWVSYFTTSTAIQNKDGNVIVRVKYNPDDNKHIKHIEEEICWGEAELTIPPGATSGKAYWHDSNGKNDSGPAKWKMEKREILEARERTTVDRIARQQGRFRTQLMKYDGTCVLTGESTATAIEAAHIVPASRGGAEIVENGFLLRADLHRLFDANLLRISMNGIVSVDDAAGSRYKTEFSGKKLPEKTITRIRRYLVERELGG